jgi:haloalkane dehalogenase
MHLDWGGGLGVSYAGPHPDNVVGIAAMEAVLRTSTWSDANLIERLLFKRIRQPAKGDRMNMNKNFFVKRILPMMVKRKLTQQELDAYRARYTTRASRKPVAVWPCEIPFDGEPADMHAEISANYDWRKSAAIPRRPGPDLRSCGGV